MALALEQAARAGAAGDVPVGCVIVDDAGAILGTGFNEREARPDPCAHAEIVALRRSAAKLGRWRLVGTTAYVTLEPCVMCAGALVHARVARVVFGAFDAKAGAVRSRYMIGLDGQLNHHIEWTGGVLEKACRALLQDFFEQRRKPHGP